jgi:hypothetical protein
MDELQARIDNVEDFDETNCRGTALHFLNLNLTEKYYDTREFDKKVKKHFTKIKTPLIGALFVVRSNLFGDPNHAGVIVETEPEILVTDRECWKGQIRKRIPIRDIISDYGLCHNIKYYVRKKQIENNTLPNYLPARLLM